MNWDWGGGIDSPFVVAEGKMTNFHSLEEQQTAARIALGVLNAVDDDRAVTQLGIAADLGIAVGRVNAYLKRYVNKGFVKVQQVPKRRYTYSLTPKGFAEKSRLTTSYLLYSFDFFRQARTSCDEALGVAAARGWKSLILIGRGEMAEIALVCALHRSLRFVALVDQAVNGREGTFASLPLVSNLGAVAQPFDGALITDIAGVQVAYDAAVAELGAARVLVPDLLTQGMAAPQDGGGEA